MKIKKGNDYDIFSDSCYDIPECPECGMPILGITVEDIGHTIMHDYCGTKVEVEDSEWLRKYIEDFTGERTEQRKCMSCGGMMTIEIVKFNGKWVTLRGRCEKCGMRFIV